jgi:photosynthetic reaction center cytochrome c subunit
LKQIMDMTRLTQLTVAFGATAAIACSSAGTSTSTAVGATTPAPSAASAQPIAVRTAAPVDSFAAQRQRAVTSMLQRIAGTENAPAESVFQNIKTLKGVPAGHLLAIMNETFGHGLGVSCGFCHVPGQWASDEKPNKNIARDMVAMVGRVNADLKSMRNLPDSNPMIGCMTCHRGDRKPVLSNTTSR